MCLKNNIGVIIISNIKSLFKHWKKNHKNFFTFGRIQESTLFEAQESLVHFFEQNNVKSFVARTCMEHLREPGGYMYFVLPILLGLTLDSYQVLSRFDETIHSLIWAVLICLSIATFPIVSVVNRIVIGMSRRDADFLRSALQMFIDMHPVYKDFTFTYAQLRGGLSILIPTEAESIYNESVHQSKYYWGAYLIHIQEGNQKYEYVFYTNRTYEHTQEYLYPAFYNACKEQIGKNWDKGIVRFSAERLES